MSLFKYAILAAGLIKFFTVSSKKFIFRVFLRNEIIKTNLEVR